MPRNTRIKIPAKLTTKNKSLFTDVDKYLDDLNGKCKGKKFKEVESSIKFMEHHLASITQDAPEYMKEYIKEQLDENIKILEN